MIVFDLHCGACAHRFEAWFGSSASYDDQQARQLVACPLCAATDVSKAPMSPRISGTYRDDAGAAPVAGEVDGPATPSTPAPTAAASLPVSVGGEEARAATLHRIIEKAAAVQADMLKDSTWVGNRFAEQARAMHYGETPAAAIHGEVDKTEARTLQDEGVAVAPLPFPVVPPKLQN